MRSWSVPLILVFAASCAAHAPSSKPVTLPSVELETLEASAAPIQTTVGGKVALVSFWATWCTSCEKEFDALNRLDARAKERGALVLGVAVGETVPTVAEFVRRRHLTYAQLIDEDFKLADALGERRVPATLVLDRAGRVVYSGGALDEEALAAFRQTVGE